MRYLMTFSYDGSNYNGYQKQVNKNTIQDNLEDNLSKILNEKIVISSSGRTDAKVHALNQKAHFDTSKKIDVSKIKYALNKLINDDIYVKSIKKVPDDFHARFNVLEKTYVYKLNMGDYNPFERNYVYQYNQKLDVEKMIRASKYLIGKHNFKSFTKADNKEDYIRIIYSIDFKLHGNILSMEFKGSGFLRYMVRNIVGTLIEVGSGKIEVSDVKKILKLEDRKEAGITAPPEGLYLKNVKY